MELFVWKALWKDQLWGVFAKLWALVFLFTDSDIDPYVLRTVCSLLNRIQWHWGFHQKLLPSKSLGNMAILIIHLQWVAVQCLTSGPRRRDSIIQIRDNCWFTKSWLSCQELLCNRGRQIKFNPINQPKASLKQNNVENSGILNTDPLGLWYQWIPENPRHLLEQWWFCCSSVSFPKEFQIEYGISLDLGPERTGTTKLLAEPNAETTNCWCFCVLWGPSRACQGPHKMDYEIPLKLSRTGPPKKCTRNQDRRKKNSYLQTHSCPVNRFFPSGVLITWNIRFPFSKGMLSSWMIS